MTKAATGRALPAAIDFLIVVYGYMLMEWLFLATKPSFMVTMTWTEKIAIALTATLGPVIIGASLFTLFAIVQKTLPSRLRSITPWLLAFPRALVLSALGLLLVDNFTLTVIGFGVRDTSNLVALSYFVVWLAALVFVWRQSVRKVGHVETSTRAKRTTLIALLAMSVTAASALLLTANDWEPDTKAASKTLPDILFFASDGIDARYLSAYGYERQTSPNLDALLPASLVFKAAISNAARTTGSTTAMLTGKYPTTTKVLFPPHALRGADAFEHLPGILRDLGYQAFQSTIRYYADAPDLNMREAFDFANRRPVGTTLPEWLPPRIAVALADAGLMLERLWDRIASRLLHISLQKPIQDVYAAVSDDPAQVYGFRDRTRINQAKLFIRRSDGPIFMHIHLMNSHCCRFKPLLPVFSLEQAKQDRKNREIYFADAILESDRFFGELLAELEAQGRLENTLIVYSSDHGIDWRANQRVPLIFRFPGGKHSGEVRNSVQLIDVAPTVLDYLGVPEPPWMEGVSLLSEAARNEYRPLFSIGGVNREVVQTKRDKVSRLVGSGPPSYGMNSMQMTICNRWYSLSMGTGKMTIGHLRDHPSACPGKELIGYDGARRLLSAHLSKRGIPMPREVSE